MWIQVATASLRSPAMPVVWIVGYFGIGFLMQCKTVACSEGLLGEIVGKGFLLFGLLILAAWGIWLVEKALVLLKKQPQAGKVKTGTT